MSSLRERYLQTLKPLAVEEPIDVIWHRLLGYVVARASEPTPISADAITIAAIFVGIFSGLAIAIPFAHHMLWGAALCTFSAVLDCADGQLARMRKKSSPFGRMLDGVSDSVVMAAIVAGAVAHLAEQHAAWWIWPLIALTIPTCTFHFAHYDHYKNVYLRMTSPTYREGEDLETALTRREAEIAQKRPGLLMRGVWSIYLYYVRSQRDFILATDPYTSARLNLFPPYDATNAEIYARSCLGPMRVWRSLFGLGTHVFVFSLATAFDRYDLYVIFRFGILNAVAYGWLIWWQRRASRAAFEQLGLHLPDQRRANADASPSAV